jgi:hypothetical protein
VVAATRSKALSWPEIAHRAAVFAGEWAEAKDERAQSQTFWIRFLECFGIRPERVATFEHTVTRFSTEQRGFIDLFWPGMLLVEQKGAGKDLDKATFQALDYLPGLKDHELPKLIVMCDFQRFRGRVLATGEEFEFNLEDLAQAANLDHFGFIAGYNRVQFGSAVEEAASVEAAKLMSGLYEQMRLDRYQDEAASIFLTRILFLMFGDDTALWESHLFEEFVRTRTTDDGSDLGTQLAGLFQVLDTPVEDRSSRVDDVAARFPYVNGTLFTDVLEIPYFDRNTRDQLLLACTFNWGLISPAVFGSMFQAVKDKKSRNELGEHYTTETNILKVIRPLFLDELRVQFDRSKNNRAGLQKLLERLEELRFLDPAAGCGNFLVVAYRELRDLELDIRIQIRKLTGDYQGEFIFAEHLAVTIDHFYGIEIDWWPAKIAEVAMFLVDHLANQKMAQALGWAPSRLPLTIKPTIVHDNALTIDWADILAPSSSVYVYGNPPFLGHDSRTPQQSEELRNLWGQEIGRIDYVTGWYAKALNYFGTSIQGHWAFVSTSSITQGQPVPLVFGRVLSEGWNIAFAHRTFAWSSEVPGAAAVHCVIVGFARGKSDTARLFDYREVKGAPTERIVKNINAYLIEAQDLLVVARNKPLVPSLIKVGYGSRPNDGGAFTVEPADLDRFLKDSHASKYLRKFVGARELLHSETRWVLWMVGVDPEDIARSALLRERLEAVRDHRLASDRAATRQWADRPNVFDFISQPSVPYLCIPAHSSEDRRYLATERFGADVIASNAVFTTPDPDGLQFALISSAMFMSWQKAIGGRLESRIRFSNTLVWNNFPAPDLTEKQTAAIIAAGRAVIDARTHHPERTLAQHYSALAMDPDLYAAHTALDTAVDKAFGAKARINVDSARQALLFARYAELTATDQLVMDAKPRREKERRV